MIRITYVAAVLLALSAPVFAQEHQGMWHGEGEGRLTVDLTHLQDDIYGISINTIVPISEMGGGCAGGVDGEVILGATGGNLFVENEGYDGQAESSPMNQRYCEVGLTFGADGNFTIEERAGCSYYHGASCSFTGTLEHEAAGL